jgi:HSP20 family molecular chaperone IbpA
MTKEAAITHETRNGSQGRPVFSPRTEIFETRDDDVVVVAEMPGVDESAVEVTLEDDVLTISGRTRDVAPEGYRRVYGEFERGDYRRSFALSEEADAEKIEASMKDGILRVRVPKAKPATRRIPVAAGNGA